MPSAQLLHGVANRQPISTSFQTPHSFRHDDVIINMLSTNACGSELTGINAVAVASATYPAASRVLAFPFVLGQEFLVQKVFVVWGTTVSTDSWDIGVYDEAGTTLLIHGGSTLAAGGNDQIQEADPTDVLLTPGRYWCAYVQSGVTATPRCITAALATNLRACGMAQMAGSGSTLGSTFTPAGIASVVFPLFGIAARTLVG